MIAALLIATITTLSPLTEDVTAPVLTITDQAPAPAELTEDVTAPVLTITDQAPAPAITEPAFDLDGLIEAINAQTWRGLVR